jgi:hypothetical protein
VFEFDLRLLSAAAESRERPTVVMPLSDHGSNADN